MGLPLHQGTQQALAQGLVRRTTVHLLCRYGFHTETRVLTAKLELESADEAIAIQVENASVPITIIEPSRGWVALKLGELWEYRELLYFLTWREVKVRYKQTALGVAWAIIQPLFTMLVFSLFFGRLAKVPSDGIPYPLFTLAGLIPWTFFANGLNLSSNSLVSSTNLISKVYFPRLRSEERRVGKECRS